MIFLLFKFLLVFCVALGFNSLSMASEKPDQLSSVSHAEKIYDPFGWSTDTFVFSVVVFGLVFITLAQTAWPKISKALDDREQQILNGVEAAQKARDEAVKAQAQVEIRLREAGDKVRQILDEARRDGQHTREDLLSKAKEEIAAERDRQKREILLAVDQAIQQLMLRTTDLATDIARRALKRDLPQETHQALQREAIAELAKISNPRFGSN